MAESLERSRKKWLIEGIFERYWTKPPPKKKNAPVEELNNPPKDSMTKIGTCTITIEPHSFDAIMYTIKDSNSRSTFHPPPQPMYRPIMQYGPPNGMMPPPLPSPAPQQQAIPAQPNTDAAPPPAPLAYDTEKNRNGGSTQPGVLPNVDNGAPYPNTPTPAVAPNSPVVSSLPNSGTKCQPPPVIQSAQQPSPVPAPQNTSSPSPTPAPTKSSDPVIQMLAERAATDPDLKALMRVVADGKAATRELKRFQAHIDELTKLLHARQASAAAAAAAAAPPRPPPPQSPAPPSHPQNIPLPPNNARQSPVTTTPQRPALPQQSPHVQGHRIHTPQPQSLRSKGPPPAPKPDISGVAFEFVGGSGDRFLFPKYSVLEYMGGFVIASFLIVRKGSSADAKSYDPQLDYYQPVTVRIYANQPRILDSLAKVVAHPEEVRRYMDDIMDNMTRAEYVLLAMQLPRDSDRSRGDGERSARQSEDVTAKEIPAEDQVMWMASANGYASKQKAIKQPLSEEDHYRSFISTIS